MNVNVATTCGKRLRSENRRRVYLEARTRMCSMVMPPVLAKPRGVGLTPAAGRPPPVRTKFDASIIIIRR